MAALPWEPNAHLIAEQQKWPHSPGLRITTPSAAGFMHNVRAHSPIAALSPSYNTGSCTRMSKLSTWFPWLYEPPAKPNHTHSFPSFPEESVSCGNRLSRWEPQPPSEVGMEEGQKRRLPRRKCSCFHGWMWSVNQTHEAKLAIINRVKRFLLPKSKRVLCDEPRLIPLLLPTFSSEKGNYKDNYFLSILQASLLSEPTIFNSFNYHKYKMEISQIKISLLLEIPYFYV